MKFVLDTHSHTIVSGHAYNTMKEMVDAASEKGLQAISLTDHAPELPGTTGLFHFMNLYVVPRKMKGVELFLGVELNIMDETGRVDLPEEVYNNLDIVIASIHAPRECYGDSKGIALNTQAYLNAMKHKGVDIIGHPDDGRYPVDYDTLAAAAKEHQVLLELNNSSLNPRGYRPNAMEHQIELLEMCKKYGTGISLGSDAHVDVDLGNFGRVSEVLATCDFPEELIVNTSVDKLKKHLNRWHNKYSF